MRLSDFTYDLPEELIAQRPVEGRSGSRLMVVGGSHVGGPNLDASGPEVLHIEDSKFSDLPGYLREGDLLILNDTKVIRARLLGRKTTGGAVEILLVRPAAGETQGGSSPGTESLRWQVMAKSSKVLKTGTRLTFAVPDPGCTPGDVPGDAPGGARGGTHHEETSLTAVVTAPEGGGFYEVEFSLSGGLTFMEALQLFGSVPLPPYIKGGAGRDDSTLYQTVYASEAGAVAAPTAGLHFTEELLKEIEARDVAVRTITLHTGPGTFLPVRVENIEEHRMHSEWYSIPPSVMEEVLKRRSKKGERACGGGRVVAVGTTTVRALESAMASGRLTGETDIFIYPPFDFKCVDMMITNLHLPESTLLMLISAFGGIETVRRAYERAVEERYRFFSYGDAMLIYKDEGSEALGASGEEG